MKVIVSCLRRITMLVTLAVALLVGVASPSVSAHAVLVGSTPRQGAVTASPPAQVVLEFSEGVALSADALRVLAPDGARVDSARPRSDGATRYVVGLKDALGPGTYTVAFHVVSADSHPVAGAFTFSIGHASSTAATPDEPDNGSSLDAVWAALRIAAYAGLLVLVGAVAFILLCWPQACSTRIMRRLLVGSWLTAVGTTVVMLVLRGAYTGTQRWSAVADGSSFLDAAGTRFSLLLWIRLLVLAAAAVAWPALTCGRRIQVRPQQRKFVGGLLGAVLVATWAAAEHASAGLQVALAIPVDALHLLAAGVWTGGLVSLAFLLVKRPDLPDTAVNRFSRTAQICVTTLVFTGVYQAWRQIGSVHNLGTDFGRLLLVKSALVTALVAVGSFSWQATRRLRSTPTPAVSRTLVAAGRGADDSKQGVESKTAGGDEELSGRAVRHRLRRTVAVEAVIAAAVLSVTGFLTSTEPARAQRAAAVAAQQTTTPMTATVPFDTHSSNGKGEVSLVLDPGVRGANAVHVTVTTAHSKLLDVPQIDVSLTSRTAKLGPLHVPLKRISEGHWSADAFQIPMTGRWEAAVTVRTTDIDQVTVRHAFTVR